LGYAGLPGAIGLEGSQGEPGFRGEPGPFGIKGLLLIFASIQFQIIELIRFFENVLKDFLEKGNI
jgi:hypothetical protein